MKRKRIGKRGDEQSLCKARDANEKSVTSGEERDQKELDNFFLSDDPLFKPFDDFVSCVRKLLHASDVRRSRARR